MKDIGSKSDKAGHRQRRARVRNVLLGNLISRDHQHCRVNTFSLRTCQESANRVRSVVLEHDATVLNLWIVQDPCGRWRRLRLPAPSRHHRESCDSRSCAAQKRPPVGSFVIAIIFEAHPVFIPARDFGHARSKRLFRSPGVYAWGIKGRLV